MVTGSRVERKRYEKKQTKTQQNGRRPSQNKQPAEKGKWAKRIFLLIVSLGVIALLAGGGLFTYYAMSSPDLTMEDLRGQVSSKIYDRNGQLVKSLGGQNRDLMEADEIPTVLKDAVLAIEDTRFYDHRGVDPIRIIGAALANLQSGEIEQGGSTITQQLVKLSVFSTDFQDQTLERKAQEAWLAVDVEQRLSKDEILTLYLNKMFYSNNVYGAKTAAQTFFGKNIQDLNFAEAALLAGIPQAPSQYDPYSYPVDAKERRDLVLDVMLDQGMITSQEHQEAVNTSIESMLEPLSDETVTEMDLMVDAYLDIVSQEVQDKMNINIFTDGVEVYTNLDLSAQRHLFETVHNRHGELFPDDQMQTAVSIVDVDTGELYALMGGRNQEVAMGLNRSDTLNRSVGSTMKPLSAYGPAIEYLNYSTANLVVDEPYSYTNGDEIDNFDFDYKGNQTLREALSGSRNIPALKMLQDVGLDQAYSFLQKMDINITNNNQRELVESNAIGGEMSPIQLSAAYATIANYGVYHQPFTVNRVVTQAGTVQEFAAAPRQAMKDSTAYMLVDILKGVPGPFASAAQIDNLYHGGKTGTTNYTVDQLAQLGLDASTYAAPDGWYAGFSPQFAIASWVGYDNPLQAGNYLTLDDTRIPQMIYHEMMTFMMRDVPVADWQKPSSVTEMEVEKYTNPLKKPSPYTPAHLRSSELFIRGSEPTEVSEAYRVISPPSGFDAYYNEENRTIEAFWNPIESQQGVFELSVNGTVIYTGRETAYIIPAAEPGYYEIRLRIIEGNSWSDTLVITFDLIAEETTEEETTGEETTGEDDDDDDDDDNPATPPVPNPSNPAEDAINELMTNPNSSNQDSGFN